MPHKMAGNNGTTSPPSEAGSSATRLQRNLAEKQRRDKLNGFISELATIVPMVSMASKRLDKTSILRLSAAHLRISQSSLGNSKRSKRGFKWCPQFLNSEQVREILEAVDGFLMVTTPSGKILYISQTVENFLGHQNIEMIGHAVYSFIHPLDIDSVRSQLQELCEAATQQNGNSGQTRCSFYCRMRERSQPRSDVLTYQFVHVVGHMTPVPSDRDEENGEKSEKSNSSNSMFKAFVKVVRSNPYNELSLADAIEDEYVTRHSLDGTIIFADHRLSTITGHLPHEVFGMSAYEYIVQDDIPIALFAHQLMFSSNQGTGMIVYRLRTKDAGFVYLKSTGILQFERSSTQVDHFMCVNKQLSDSAGDQELKNFIDRFTPHINDSSTSSLLDSIKAIQISGLKVPIASSTKNGATSDSKLSFPLLTSKHHGESSTKVEPIDQTTTNGSKHKSKGNKSSSTSGSRNVTKKASSSQAVLGSYSKHAQEKMVLEENPAEPMFTNHSPLTAESSLSGNSPQSDDTYVTSPDEAPLESMDDILAPIDECSVSDLPNSTLLGGETIAFLDCEDSRGQSLLLIADGMSNVEGGTIFQQDKNVALLSTPVLLIDAKRAYDESSPRTASYLSSVDMTENNCATHSDSILSSMSDPSDKGSDIC